MPQLVATDLAINLFCKKIVAEVDMRFITKTAAEVDMNIAIKTIAEVDMRFAVKTLAEGVILGASMNMKLGLTKQDIMVLLQVTIVGSEMGCY